MMKNITKKMKDKKMNESYMNSIYKVMVVGMTLGAIFISTIVSAQDTAVSVSPVYVTFKNIETATSSNIVTVTLTNKSYGANMPVGSVSLSGPHSSSFSIQTDGCSSQSLADGSSCDMQVKFTPLSDGKKNAFISIPYATDGNLSVFLSNSENTAHAVQRRLPPVMQSLSISEEMNASTSYDMSWTAMGYHSGYQTLMVMFDCTNVVQGECGASYNSAEKFYETTFISPQNVTDGTWSYNGEIAQNFQYVHTYSIPATRADSSAWDINGTPVVIRFYVNSTEDIEAGKLSLSMIIPGKLSNNYYDTSGRKVQKLICPVGGCN